MYVLVRLSEKLFDEFRVVLGFDTFAVLVSGHELYIITVIKFSVVDVSFCRLLKPEEFDERLFSREFLLHYDFVNDLLVFEHLDVADSREVH